MSHRAALGGRNTVPTHHHHPVLLGPGRVRTGTEPLTAYSALGLRLVLSVTALPVFAAGAAGFSLWAVSAPAGSPGPGFLVTLAVICGVLAIVAAIDIVVIRRRRSEGQG